MEPGSLRPVTPPAPLDSSFSCDYETIRGFCPHEQDPSSILSNHKQLSVYPPDCPDYNLSIALLVKVFGLRRSSKKRGKKDKKLVSSISTNVCTVTHPCDIRSNPTKPRSVEIQPSHLITPWRHLLRRFSSPPPPECRNPPGWNNRFFPVGWWNHSLDGSLPEHVLGGSRFWFLVQIQ
jgi:hypothetical protein